MFLILFISKVLKLYSFQSRNKWRFSSSRNSCFSSAFFWFFRKINLLFDEFMIANSPWILIFKVLFWSWRSYMFRCRSQIFLSLRLIWNFSNSKFKLFRSWALRSLLWTLFVSFKISSWVVCRNIHLFPWWNIQTWWNSCRSIKFS